VIEMKKPASATVFANVIATEKLQMVSGGVDPSAVQVLPKPLSLKAERVQ
jgi:hypothetical protein